jgi:hypothetical protein
MTTIYTLSDPITNEIRYVGKTTRSPQQRLAGHIKAARRGMNTYVARWLRQVGMPILGVVREVNDELGAQEERAMIALYRQQGCRLTNLTDGGEGSPGWIPTEETRRKISASLVGNKYRLGIPHTEETKKRIGEKSKGNKYSLGVRPSVETRAKLSAVHKGNKYNLGRKLSAEHKMKISLSLQGNQYAVGYKHTAETKTRISQSLLGNRRAARTT